MTSLLSAAAHSEVTSRVVLFVCFAAAIMVLYVSTPPSSGRWSFPGRNASSTAEGAADHEGAGASGRFIWLAANESKTSTSVTSQNNRTYLILFWTPLFNAGSRYWFEYFGQQFAELPCASACKLTDKKELIRQADMIIFSNYAGDQIPPPTYRNPNQIWAFFSQESPATYPRSEKDLAAWKGRFNWTITYRRDSDVPVLAGKIIPKKTAQNGSQTNSTNSDTSFDNEVKRIIAEKKDVAAAIISHCPTDSGRDEYVAQLVRAGLPVHVYGKCGKHRCPTRSRSPGACYAPLSRRYRFFLAFENSLCRDYVTEKLYEALRHPWVPVVRGGADYARSAPPGSVLDASRMDAADLAAAVRRIAADDTLYAGYFEWKRTLDVARDPPWACEACEKLRRDVTSDPDGGDGGVSTAGTGSSSGRRSYPDIYDWWVTKGSCRPG